MASDTNRHVPVLLNKCVEAFSNVGDGTLVDCTLGGAGHSAALLEKYPRARLLACDMDEKAIDAAKKRLAKPVAEKRVEFFHGNFSQLVDTSVDNFAPGFAPPWSGVLMDLGYSSNQLESAEYGMSFMVDGPVDMRLSRPPKGPSAWDLIQDSTDEELGDILFAYGEIRNANSLARKIREAAGSGAITDSTASLAQFIEKVSGGRAKGAIHPATLVFQALRIAVNDELRVLDHFLEGVILKLGKPGRIGIITFHSLEDRLVKRWGQKHATKLRALTKKPITASEEEIADNPRSRSAKLRVYERL